MGGGEQSGVTAAKSARLKEALIDEAHGTRRQCCFYSHLMSECSYLARSSIQVASRRSHLSLAFCFPLHSLSFSLHRSPSSLPPSLPLSTPSLPPSLPPSLSPIFFSPPQPSTTPPPPHPPSSSLHPLPTGWTGTWHARYVQLLDGYLARKVRATAGRVPGTQGTCNCCGARCCGGRRREGAASCQPALQRRNSCIMPLRLATVSRRF